MTKNGNLGLDSSLFDEKVIIINEYRFIFQLKKDFDSSTKEKIISINANSIHNNDFFTYEKILKYKEFQTIGELFKLCKNIEHIFELFSNLIKKKKEN